MVVFLPAFAHSQVDRDTDWSSLHFVSLIEGHEGVNPIAGGGVAMAVQILADSTDSHYLETFEQGRTWDCIRMVLNAMLGQQMFATDSPFGSHSGKNWSFWRDVAEVERVAASTNAPLGKDTYRVLDEMEAAFSELLDPDEAEEHFFGKKLPEK